jgi:hypothetical protein
MLVVDGPLRPRNPAKCPGGFHILSPLSKYLIMRIGGDPAFFPFLPQLPQCRRSPFHRLFLYDHPNYILEAVMFFFLISSYYLSIPGTHVLHRVTATLQYLLVDSIVYTTSLVNRPKV